jgi:hypothetical protein
MRNRLLKDECGTTRGEHTHVCKDREHTAMRYKLISPPTPKYYSVPLLARILVALSRRPFINEDREARELSSFFKKAVLNFFLRAARSASLRTMQCTAHQCWQPSARFSLLSEFFPFSRSFHFLIFACINTALGESTMMLKLAKQYYHISIQHL